MKKIISIIIPISIKKNTLNRLKRLEKNLHFFSNQKISSSFEIVIVDSSIYPFNKRIKNLSLRFKNYRYVYYTLENDIYSAAKARNYGVLHASSDYILFYDVDLVINETFIQNLFDDLKELEKQKNKFFIYPCLYLTEKYTKLIENINNINFNEIKESYLKGYNDKVLYLAVNTSTILVNTKHFINIGMYNENFKGHGYEDFELIHRLYINYTQYKIDEDYLIDFKTNFPAKYQGFRKYFSYLSLPNFFRDMYTIHLWHPRPLTNKYYKVRKHNQKYFLEYLKKDLKKYTDSKEKLLPYDKFINNLLVNYNIKDYSGLYKYNKSVTNTKPKNNIKRKLRKLILHPIDFFIDAFNNAFRKINEQRNI